MQSIREWPDATATDTAAPIDRPTRTAALLQVLATGGYGIWLWLGLSLLLGLSRLGRSGTLVPLGLGAVLVGAGLVLACLRVPGLATWHGWRPRPGHRPTRSALMALVTWLPVLAVAGLAHGDNSFWVTRLAGALLMLCSLVSLLLATHDDRASLPAPLQRATALLPACRITLATYTGGLWLWLSVLAQGGFDGGRAAYLWILLLLALALGLGLLESGLWQSLREPETPTGGVAGKRGRFPLRLVAALLSYALPCTALLLGGTAGSLLAAALAAPGCMLGQLLERYLYEAALADAAGTKPAWAGRVH
jgi:sulfite dehydrogenase (quinone) subunit SoeC